MVDEVILCAAGDIHGALGRLFEDVLALRNGATGVVGDGPGGLDDLRTPANSVATDGPERGREWPEPRA